MAKTVECPECKLIYDPRGIASHRTRAHGVDPKAALEHQRKVAVRPGEGPIPSSPSSPASSSAAPSSSPASPTPTRSLPSAPRPATAGSSTSALPKRDRDPLGLESAFDRLFGG